LPQADAVRPLPAEKLLLRRLLLEADAESLLAGPAGKIYLRRIGLQFLPFLPNGEID